MNTHSTVLNDASVEPTNPDRILQTALAAWRQGNFVAAANQFNDQFTFTDHALGLEFKDKGRLTEFLAKTPCAAAGNRRGGSERLLAILLWREGLDVAQVGSPLVEKERGGPYAAGDERK